ncbi:MAG TPA: YIP1 family protein [Gemmatimonadaceae bacterium]|jgi:hypothetical protein|nr:YIP1 family protein [Gemmatimonadaceae bacterium]
MGIEAGSVNDAQPAPSKASLWEDFVDIFYNPSAVFARRANGEWGKPLLLLVVTATVLYFLTKNAMQPIMDAEFARRGAETMAKNPQVTEEQLASGRHVFEMFGFVFVAIGTLISVLASGVVLWMLSKLFDAKEALAAALMVAAYSEVPRILQILVNAAQALFLSPDKLTSMNSVLLGPARFMDPDHSSAALVAMASRLDVFTIWVTVLMGIGIYIVGKLTKQQAIIIAVVTWVVGGLPALFGALRGG